MGEALQVAAIWLGLAVLSTILASRLNVSMALVEICVGAAAGAIVDRFVSPGARGSDLPRLSFVASATMASPSKSSATGYDRCLRG